MIYCLICIDTANRSEESKRREKERQSGWVGEKEKRQKLLIQLQCVQVINTSASGGTVLGMHFDNQIGEH